MVTYIRFIHITYGRSYVHNHHNHTMEKKIMSQLSKENYETVVSILADHNASDELAGALANYFEQDNPLVIRELFLKKFFL